MKLVKAARLFVVFVVTVCAVGARAQQSSKCDYVVQQVSFENTTGLTVEQSSALQKTLLGRCFLRNNPAALSDAVYKQLCKWGFKLAMVEDPNHGNSVRVLNAAVHPSPVAVVIDFQLYGTDNSQTAQK